MKEAQFARRGAFHLSEPCRLSQRFRYAAAERGVHADSRRQGQARCIDPERIIQFGSGSGVNAAHRFGIPSPLPSKQLVPLNRNG